MEKEHLKTGDRIIHYSMDWQKHQRRSSVMVSKDGIMYKVSPVSISPDPAKIFLHWQNYEITSVVIKAISKIVKI